MFLNYYCLGTILTAYCLLHCSTGGMVLLHKLCHQVNIWLPVLFQMENNVRNMSAITNVTGNCSQNFVRVELANNSQCVPVCGEWKELPQNVVVMFQIFQSVLNTIHFIGTVLALVLCCYNHNVM